MQAAPGSGQGDGAGGVWRRRLAGVALGQVLSLAVTGTGACSSGLAFRGLDAPAFQSLPLYLLLLLYSLPLLRANTWLDALRHRWLAFLLLAAADVEANYLAVKAYQYTSITSVMLLDCFTIPVVMLLAFLVFRERFAYLQVGAVCICVLGMLVLLASDAVQSMDDSDSNGSQMVFGDILVLCASVLYAISNTGQQFVVQRYSDWEYLAFLGLFGSFISCVQVLLLERSVLQEVTWTWEIVLLFAAFVGCLLALYSLVPLMLRLAGATTMNLSLLTADAYSLIVGVVLFEYQPSLLYFVSLFVIVSGLLLYNWAQHRHEKKKKQAEEEEREEKEREEKEREEKEREEREAKEKEEREAMETERERGRDKEEKRRREREEKRPLREE